MIGLQGSGKTTSSGKIALWLKGKGKRPLLAAADVYRPAAIKQLEIIGEKIAVPVFSLGADVSPVEIADKALALAEKQGHDYLIIDTAGRLQIDQKLMAELKHIKSRVNPAEILLTVDAMSGQDAVNVAQTFNEELTISGVVLTKLDGDARGGAALSVKAITGCPIKFTGTGEKMEALEPFYPERMASRILGMGDVLTLIEKAQAALDEKKAAEMEARLRQSSFGFNDYLDQLEQIKKMGDMKEMLSMLPGVGKKIKNMEIDDKQLVYAEAMIKSMTLKERDNPSIINGSRKLRIAKGSGCQVQDVNRLLKQHEQMRKMLKQMNIMPDSAKGKKGKKGKKGGKNRNLLANFPFMR
jgi:signal recognition particle subunit SRP54